MVGNGREACTAVLQNILWKQDLVMGNDTQGRLREIEGFEEDSCFRNKKKDAIYVKRFAKYQDDTDSSSNTSTWSWVEGGAAEAA